MLMRKESSNSSPMIKHPMMASLLLCKTTASLTRTPFIYKSLAPAVTSHHAFQKRNMESQAAQSDFFQSISESSTVAFAQEVLENIHSVSGLPWWASIGMSTVLFRTAITFPLTIYQNKIFAKLENIQVEMKELVPEMKRETAIAIKQFKWTEKEAKNAWIRSMKKQNNLRIIRDNCHPFKSTVVIWAQLPMWICLSMALRNMSNGTLASTIESQITFLEMNAGGFLWIPNLTVPDASWILPVFLGLINLAIIELQVANRLSRAVQPSKLQIYMTNFFRLISVVLVPISATVPSCMSLYWTVSSICGLSHNLIIMNPKFRRFVNIPLSPREIQNPYENLAIHLKEKAKIFK